MRLRRDILQRLGCQQHRYAIGGAAELRRRGSHVAQLHERIVDERMVDDVNRHDELDPRFNGVNRSR